MARIFGIGNTPTQSDTNIQITPLGVVGTGDVANDVVGSPMVSTSLMSIGITNTYGEFGLRATGNSIARYWKETAYFGAPLDKMRGFHGTQMLIDVNGTLWAFGTNSYGQLGLGDTTAKTYPVLTYAKVIDAATHSASALIDASGEIWTCGTNTLGQTGLGNISGNTLSWTKLDTGATRFNKIRAGGSYIVALTTNGKMWGWGQGANGVFGGTSVFYTPTEIFNTYTMTKISCGNYFMYAKDVDGKFYVWGYNNAGQLGLNDTTQRSSPVEVVLPDGLTVADFNAGYDSGILVDSNGEIWVTGSNSNGRTGLNTITGSTLAWTKLDTGATRFVNVSMTRYGSTYAIDTTGRLWCCGANSVYELGFGDNTQRLVLTQNPDTTTYAETYEGSNAMYLKGTDGFIYACGSSNNSTFGGNICKYFSKVNMGLSQVKQAVYANSLSTVLIHDTDGTVYWSGNGNAFGTNETSARYAYTRVNYNKYSLVNAGTNVGFYIGDGVDSGKLYTGGSNTNYRTGLATNAGTTTVITQIGSDTDWAYVESQNGASAAIKTGGELYTWGFATNYCNGHGDTVEKQVPTRVGAGLWKAVTVGSANSSSAAMMLAINSTDELYSWGPNTVGMTGQNTQTGNTTTPTRVGINTWKKVSAGYDHVLGIDINNHLYAWGANGSYQIGDATTASRLVPTLIDDTLQWKAVYAGYLGSAAVTVDDIVYVWGRGYALGLENNSTNIWYYTTPTKLSMNKMRVISLRYGSLTVQNMEA